MISRADMTPPEVRFLDSLTGNGRPEFAEPGAEIRAAVVCQTILNRRRTTKPRILSLTGVHISGEVDLEAGQVAFPVKFEQCEFEKALNLEQGQAPALYFVDCYLPGLRGTQLRTTGNLMLRGCVVSGPVELAGAHIQGQLDLRGTQLLNAADFALLADGLRVDQDMLCRDEFKAEGMTRMVGACIGGQFSCDGASFSNRGGIALELSGLIVKEHTFWCDQFTVDGQVRLRGARMEGRFDCSGATFRHPGEVAVEAVGLSVAQGVKFTSDCTVDGEVNLTGCRIGGWLDFTGGRFLNKGKKVLDLARASVAQNLIFQSGFVAEGKVLLAGAEVSGNLWCEGGRFDNDEDTAIDATGMIIHRDLRFADRIPGATAEKKAFHASGRVVLTDATVSGNFDCTGGQFDNSHGDALVAKGMAVTRDALLCGGFVAGSKVDMADSRIGGKLDCTGSEFAGTVTMCGLKAAAELSFIGAVLAGAVNGTALTLKRAVVGGPLRLGFATQPAGAVDLDRVRAGQLDDRQPNWPPEVRMNDFVYTTLPDDGPALEQRIKWLQLNPGYAPQIYRQMAAVYRAAGLDDRATRVLIAGEDARRTSRKGFLGRANRIFGWLLKPTVGYGYRPFRILWFLAALQVAGWLVFRWLGNDNFEPVRAGVSKELFNPFLYTSDLLLPVVSLKHRDLWVPQDWAVWWTAGFTVTGWILAVCLVTGLGKMFKRDT